MFERYGELDAPQTIVRNFFHIQFLIILSVSKRIGIADNNNENHKCKSEMESLVK